MRDRHDGMGMSDASLWTLIVDHGSLRVRKMVHGR